MYVIWYSEYKTLSTSLIARWESQIAVWYKALLLLEGKHINNKE